MIPDLVIRNGTVYDGTGADGRVCDVAVAGGRIVDVGDVPIAGAYEEVEAAGLVVAPGFIDIHSHSDYTLLVDPRAVSAICQGVTLEVVGNCGFGCFPISDPVLANRAIYGYSDGAVPITWTSAGGYFERLEEARPAVNVLSLVPNGQLRLATVGFEDRAATAAELRRMEDLLRESLKEGAWGYSTGLEYPWEQGAPEAEVATLARHARFYATHTRNRDEAAADAVAEALRVATKADVRVQVSHLVPRSGDEGARECARLIEEARAAGLDVAFDMHTRRFGLTYLYTALPGWALGVSSPELAVMLADAGAREQMRPHRSILSALGDWSRVVLLDNPVWPQYARRDIATIAEERRQSPLDAIYDLLLGGVEHLSQLMVILHSYSEEQQCDAFAHPLCVPGSDATTLAPTGPLADSFFHGAYTWASWYWRFMVREKGLLTPAEAVHRMTGQPAERLGLIDRGILAERARADIVVFDPSEFRDRGTTFEPNQLAEGVVHVFVNGVHTLDRGELTGARGGMVIRR